MMNAPIDSSILDRIETKKPPRKKNTVSAVLTNPPGAENHFRPLGYDGDRFYFFTAAGKQIREMTASKLGKKPELLTLAPLEWWEREFASNSGFNAAAVTMAANYLIQSCYAKGVFSLDNRRGRGVWRDYENIVIHVGDRLFVDGEETPLVSAETEAVYECQKRIELEINNPLSNTEVSTLMAWAHSLNLENKTHCVFLTGWMTCALLSGALNWRPHIFLNGPKGCGKSSVMRVMNKLLGGFVVAATGNSSAAGLRQALNSDALPVLFDEAESDNLKSSNNINDVLALMRHASSNLDAQVIKGGADGKASFSVVQSCFCLSAIRDPVHQAADQSRITHISLKPASTQSSAAYQSNTLPLADTIMSGDWAARWRGRIFSMIPQVLESINVFTEASRADLRDSRMADQVGAMLGAAWATLYGTVPTLAEAAEHLSKISLTDQRDIIESASDEQACLQAILDANVKVDGDEWHGDLRVGDLAQFMCGNDEVTMPTKLTRADARRALGMCGLRVTDDKRLMISSNNGMLARKIMALTPWPVGWNKVLARLEGAEKPVKVVKIAGAVTRCVIVPLG